MHYYVDSDCIGCGVCEGICPSVFHMTSSGKAEAIRAEISDVHAKDAMKSCPVDAIHEG